MKIKFSFGKIFLLFIVFAILLSIVELFISSPIRGGIRRYFFTPRIIEENVYIDTSENIYHNRHKIKFYETYRSGHGCYGLKYKVSGIDNGYATHYLLVNEGKLFLTLDATQGYEWPFTFKTYELKDIKLFYESQEDQLYTEVLDVTEDRYRDIIIRVYRKDASGQPDGTDE